MQDPILRILMDCPFGSNVQSLKFMEEPETISHTPILAPPPKGKGIVIV